jgi:PadR family transcriptional regulator, regulatory protein PadR
VTNARLRLSRSDADAIENLRSWLTVVVSRVCLTMLQARRSRPQAPTRRVCASSTWSSRAPDDDKEDIFLYFRSMPRRKPGTLLPLETEILEMALSMRSERAAFHGFGLAHAMREQTGSRALTGHGTLYKALSRLEEFGLLASRWEDAAAAEGRPRRRLYELTSQGADVAEQAAAANAGQATRRRPRLVSEPA